MDENLGFCKNYNNYTVKSWCNDIVDIWKIHIKNLHNGKIIEIGVHGGYSLLLSYDENINNKIYGIDCWENIIDSSNKINGINNDFWNKESLDKFLDLHKKNRLNLENIINDLNLNIELLFGFSNDNNIINKFEDNSIDAIYIDGDHSYDGCYSDLNNYYSKIKKGGLILCDDYINFITVKNAVDNFCREKNINIVLISDKCYFYK